MRYYILLALFIYLVLINAAGFLLMYIDKRKAKKRRYRIPETVLLSIAVIGGSIGVMAGMEIFRHKTKYPRFFIGVPIILLLQAALIFAFYYFIL